VLKTQICVTRPQRVKNQMLMPSCFLYVPGSVAASSLTLIRCKRYNCTHFKYYGYTRVKTFLIVKKVIFTVEINEAVFARRRFF